MRSQTGRHVIPTFFTQEVCRTAAPPRSTVPIPAVPLPTEAATTPSTAAAVPSSPVTFTTPEAAATLTEAASNLSTHKHVAKSHVISVLPCTRVCKSIICNIL